MKFSSAFLTGCDEGHEWILPWFFANFEKHCDQNIVFADFGLSENGLEYVREHVDAVMDLSKRKGQGWFLKPAAMLNCPADRTCWIDTDCEIKADLDDIFNLTEPEKLSMVKDHPWTARRGELWHNSGIEAFQGQPMILKKWEKQVREKPKVGDQEVLHSMLNPITKMTYIKDLPHRYNVLRLDVLDDNVPQDPVVMHWTGKKGKDEIRRQMNA